MGAPPALMAALAPMLMQRLAAGGMPGGPGAGPSGPGGPGTGPGGNPSDDAASMSFGRELSAARQANPAALAQRISSIREDILELINHTGMSNPKVANSLGKILPMLHMAAKEAADAAAQLQIAQPIQASAAEGAPGAGGPNPQPTGIPGMGQF